MTQTVEEIQQKIVNHLQYKLARLPPSNTQLEQCYARNQTNISQYVNCIKKVMPKLKKAQKSMVTGSQFLFFRMEQCLQKGQSPNDCLQIGMRTIEDMFKIVQNDLK